ncbi:hypothetical protein [Phaeovulum sp.]|uniref:hypothetical protein n=1 Tax=Phaeovulum sp. TaxID=2934796 RepID=UPI0035695601
MLENIDEIEMAEIAALVGDPEDPSETDDMVNAATLADWLGLTPNHVSALAREGILPRTPAKLFPLRRAIRAYCGHARTGSVGRKVDAELAAEKLRAARATAEKLEIANAKARGEIIAAAEVERAWADVLRGLRAGFLSLPSRAAAKLGHLTPHDLAALDAEVRDVLMEIAADD